jgi:hypothetical protein
MKNIFLATTMLFMLSGCSFMMNEPVGVPQQKEPIECNSKRTLPKVDQGFAIGLGVVDALMVTNALVSGVETKDAPIAAALLATTTAGVVVLAASSIVGFDKVDKCLKLKQEQFGGQTGL